MEQMPRLLDRTLVFQGYLKVERLRLEYPGAKVAVREVESHGDSVAILPFDPERRMALTVRQFRAPAFYWLEEACAGMIDGAETAEAAAFRELQEELALGHELINGIPLACER
jgi:8-oxo-dGTP pyrophosphatase MutT (NUDIX family)